MPSLLACSGGGDRLSLMLGMLYHISLNNCNHADWETVAGISAGSLAAALISQTSVSSFKKDMENIKELIETHVINAATPWTRFGSIVNGVDALFYHKGLYSHKGLEDIVNQHFHTTAIKRHILVGTYDESTSEYCSWDSRKVENLEELKRALVASCSVPVIFEPYKINNRLYLDGSMRHLIPVNEIKQWLAETDENEARRVDILLCYPINDRKKFIELTHDIFRSPLVSSMTEAVSNIMLEQFENDLKELATIINVSVNEVRQKTTQTLVRNNITFNIYSPFEGKHSSFTSPSVENNKKLFRQGFSIAESFHNPNKLKV